MDGRIVCCPDIVMRNVLIKVIKETTNIVPNRFHNTFTAQRAHYDAGMTRMIINDTLISVAKKLGYPAAIDAYEVDDPTAAAMQAQKIFEHNGYEARVFDAIEPELPRGFMVFVTIPEFRGYALLYWPKNPDMEVVKRFQASGEFGPWADYDADGAID